MKLLIITQKVHYNDDVLGFFHGWINEFAKHCESVIVICLQKGDFDLPNNVRVFSLGKEEGVSRLKYVTRFYKYIWAERNNYDAVFVHMNQEYVLLGGFFWKLLGKKITMWRNHFAGNFLTRIAMALSEKIFCTSKYSFTALSPKTILMPVGINTDLFKKDDYVIKKPNSILFLARMSPIKRPHLIIEALRLIRIDGINFTASFCGNPAIKDAQYLDSLKEKVKEYSLGDHVIFEKGVPNNETPPVYGAHTVFINPTPSGTYDKTIFEAMACESLVLTSNLNLNGQIDNTLLFKEDDVSDLAKKLKVILSFDNETKDRYGKFLRAYVIKHHSIELLVSKLLTSFYTK